MRRQRRRPRTSWNGTVTDADRRKVLALLRTSGPLTIRIEGSRGRIEAVDCMLDDISETDGAWSTRFVTQSRPRPEWPGL